MLATRNQRLKIFSRLLGFGGLLPFSLEKRAFVAGVGFRWLILDAGNNRISVTTVPATVAGSGFTALLSRNQGINHD